MQRYGISGAIGFVCIIFCIGARRDCSTFAWYRVTLLSLVGLWECSGWCRLIVAMGWIHGHFLALLS